MGIHINGISYSGKNVTIKNGKVIIDGNTIEIEEKEIKIEVNGNIDSLNVDTCEEVKVTGNVSKLKTMSGDVEISGDVTGNVETMSGDVKCGNISGKVKTMSGDIKRR